MITFKSLVVDGISVETRLKNEIRSLCSEYQLTLGTGDSFDFIGDLMNIISKYVVDVLDIHFVIIYASPQSLVLSPVTDDAIELLNLISF